MRGRGLRKNIRLLAVVGTAAVAIAYGPTASADTLEWALVQAYQNNPSLNAQRAALRAVDENVPQALSGYRPKLSVTAAGGFNYFRQLNKTVNQQSFPNTVIYSSIGEDLGTRQFGATATQTLFNGFQTANRTRQAESQVMGARETLRVTEQQVLLDAATAYMNLLRDQAILDLNRRNVEVLTEQLKQTRDRFNVGEVTRTDVAQAESRLAAGRSALLGAQSNYVTSQANYRRVIGVNPGRLDPGTPVDRLSPATLPRAITEGETRTVGAGGDVRRRRYRARGESQRRRALSQSWAHSCLHAKLRHATAKSQANERLHSGTTHGPDLSGRRRIFRHSPKQGNAWSAAA
jgi:outer membrane protein